MTGVQTCALPICSLECSEGFSGARAKHFSCVPFHLCAYYLVPDNAALANCADLVGEEAANITVTNPSSFPTCATSSPSLSLRMIPHTVTLPPIRPEEAVDTTATCPEYFPTYATSLPSLSPMHGSLCSRFLIYAPSRSRSTLSRRPTQVPN